MGLLNLGKTENERAQLDGANENFAIISFKPNGTIINANEIFLTALGYSSSEVIGQHHKIFCDKEYVKTSDYKTFWNDLDNGISQIDEFKRIRKDGSAIWIQASYTPIKNKKGKVTQVVKFAQDITTRKLETTDFEGQLEAIGKSNAVIEFDMTGTILKVNNNFLNALDYTQSDILGKKHSIFCQESYRNSNEYSQF